MSHRGKPGGVAGFRAGRGFTLLEVLLALSLGAVLMLGIFSIMRVQTRITRDGWGHVEEAQLARSILEMIARDVRNCVPVNGDASARLHEATTEIPLLRRLVLAESQDSPLALEQQPTGERILNLGIVGDEQYLILSPHRSGRSRRQWRGTTELGGAEEIKRNGKTLRDSNRTDNQPSEGTIEHGPLPAAVESETVAYFMAENLVTEPATDQEEPADTEIPELTGEEQGLARLEHVVLNVEDNVAVATPVRAPVPTAAPVPGIMSEFHSSASPHPRTKLVVVAPEVRHLKFRYLGDGWWHSNWDGQAGLPQAIEIELGLGVGDNSVKERPGAAHAAEEEGTQEDDLKTSAQETVEEDYESWDVRLYRLVVRVPAARGDNAPWQGRTSLESRYRGLAPRGDLMLPGLGGTLP